MLSLKKSISLLAFTLLTATFAFAINPSRTYKQLPDKFNMEYKAYDVKTADGATLKSWYFPAKNGVKTTKLILIAHNGEGNMSDYLRRVDQFSVLGYNVVTFDYRGFGESSEFEIDNNMYIYPHFQEDMAAMIDHCRKQFVQSFDMYGWGIGGGLALGVGWNRTEIKKIIADTPFLSMEDLEERFESWDEPMEVPFAGYDKKHEPLYALDSPPAVSTGNTKKVKLIVGSNDILFSADDLKMMQAKQPKHIEKEIHVIENPDRKDNYSVDKASYAKMVGDFLAQD